MQSELLANLLVVLPEDFDCDNLSRSNHTLVIAEVRAEIESEMFLVSETLIESRVEHLAEYIHRTYLEDWN